MRKRKIIITGRNYIFMLGMVRSIKNLNYDVVILSTDNKEKNIVKNALKKLIKGRPIESSSKYVNQYLVVGDNKENILNTIISNYSHESEKAIIIPTDDYTLSILDDNYNKLSSKFYIPNIDNKEGKINLMLDKVNQKELAKRSGLNVAKKYDISTNDGIKIPKNIEYPVFVKPVNSYKGTKDIMKKCDSKEELVSYLKKTPNIENCPLLVEQYLDIKNEYGVVGCSYNGKIYIPGVIKKIKVGKGTQNGVTLTGKNLPIDDYPDLYTKVKEFIVSMKFNGLFDVEIFECNNKFYFSEVNLRFGVYGYSWTYLGANIPEIYVNYILGNSIGNIDVKFNKIFINEKVCLGNYKSGLVSFKKYKSDMKSADFGFIYDKYDKKPYYCFKRQELIQHIMKLVKIK